MLAHNCRSIQFFRLRLSIESGDLSDGIYNKTYRASYPISQINHTMPAPPRKPTHDLPPWLKKVHEIIFEADTPAGKAFDIVLIVGILLSILVIMLNTVESLSSNYHGLLYGLEWVFTLLFTVEYALRLISVRRPLRYAFSFFGLVDLLSILPTYLGLILPGTQHLMVIRAFRLLRVFRVFKLARFLSEAEALRTALNAARAKIIVFIVTVAIIVVIMGTAMYVIEGPNGIAGNSGNPGFSSIPQSIYWAIVTITTVGYGDATPESVAGKMMAAIMMLIGYSLIIVPTGIISAEMSRAVKGRDELTTQSCPSCTREGHDVDATHCKFCGEDL